MNDNNENIEHINLNQSLINEQVEIHNQQGTADNDNKQINHTTFDTLNNEADTQIKENLTEVTEIYDDEQENKSVLDEIKLYANKIKCEDFHGKGTIEDYSQLFKAASKIAKESKQIKLDIDVEGFDEFSNAADELAQLFNGFILKLENVNIINDMEFLNSIAKALKKIWNLSEVFGKFKQTILATSTIKIPKSAQETKVIIQNVMQEVNCAMNYINHFVNNDTEHKPQEADLDDNEKYIIEKAVETIDNWNLLCEQGISTVMNNNQDINFIKQTNQELIIKTNNLKTLTNTLKNKIQNFGLISI